MLKKEKGITLVALVVTIIILLILAGVTITIALSDNGLFQKSKKAVNTWKDAERNEVEVMNDVTGVVDNLIDQYGN